MEHCLILVRTAGDLIYLATALITLAVILTDRANRQGGDPAE